jgi:hypothetical protein
MKPAAMDDGWEARMAERARFRAVIREAEEVTRFAASLELDEDFEEAWYDQRGFEII